MLKQSRKDVTGCALLRWVRLCCVCAQFDATEWKFMRMKLPDPDTNLGKVGNACHWSAMSIHRDYGSGTSYDTGILQEVCARGLVLTC